MKKILTALLGLLVLPCAFAVNYAIQDGGSDGACPNAWPPSIVGNYVENGTLNGVPRYDGNGWYLYRASVFGANTWVVSNVPGSTDLNNSTIAFYLGSESTTPPTGTGYAKTNSACGKINVQQGVTVPPPDAPQLYNLNSGAPPYVSSGKATMYWSAVAGVVGYKVDVATDAAFTAFHPGYNGRVVTASPTPPTFLEVDNLTSAGTTYYFRVRSYTGAGDSAQSNVISTTTVPASPAVQAATDVRANRFTAQWSAAAGADSYRLQVCTDAGFGSCVGGYNPAVLGDATQTLVSGLAPNTTYYYRVSAGNVNGTSAYSASTSLTTNALPTLGGTFTTAGAVNDNATIAPFSGVTVTDANAGALTVRITYAAANGTLTGTGLTGIAGNYTVAGASPAEVTARLQALVFQPTYGQGPVGTTVTTTFTLVPNDGIDNGSGNSSTVVVTTMTNVAPAFVAGTTSLTVGANSSANDVKPLLAANDSDAGQTLTWAVQTAPSHGSVQLTGTATTAGGSGIAPSGTITYTPAAGYAGNDSFVIRVSDSFDSALRTITVTVQAVAPAAPLIGTATAGDGEASVTFNAPASNGGSAITTYTATANPGGAFGTCAGPAACAATVAGLTNGTAYTFTVTATNSIGTGPSSGVSNSVTPKGSQTITFANPGAQNFGTTPTLTATAASATGTSGLTVSFTSSTTGVCTITSGGALTFVTAGSCTINADQAGDAATSAAPTVTQTFTVSATVPGAPTIGTATAGNTQATVTFTPPASTGGASILAGGYTATANPGGATGTGSGSPITVTGLINGVAYTFTVTATNAAGAGAASAASNAVTPAAPQTITFNDPGAQNFGTWPTLTATSSSGLTVVFTSSTASVCTTTSGGALMFLSSGTCTINADQAGDSSYLPAPQVSRSFAVSPAVPGAPNIGTAIAGDTQASVAFTAPVNIGGSPITSYIVTVIPPDVAPVTGASSPIVVTGLTNGQAYAFRVTAENVAGVGPASAASNSITPKSIQTITFANPGAQSFGATPTLAATADSGLTVDFTSSTPGVCTISSGGALTFVAAGACTINADQPGSATYLAAPQVTNTFTVNPMLSMSGTVPGMAGTATATLTGGGPGCTLDSANTRFMAAVSLPAGRTAPHGGFEFRATGCTGSVTVALAYPDPLPAGVAFWKFGPATPAAASSWFQWSGATLSGDRRTVSYTIADNGVGDADPATGVLRDPFVPALGGAADAVGIPVDAPWALALISALIGWFGWRRTGRAAPSTQG